MERQETTQKGEILPTQDPLPTGYKHYNVQTQIAHYRVIYDAVPEEALPTDHIEGLFDFLKNGIALVTDYINENDKGEQKKQEALKRLNELYSFVQEVNLKKEMNSLYFISFNFYLALIVDDYKGIPLGRYSLGQTSLRGILMDSYYYFLSNKQVIGESEAFEHKSLPIIIYTNLGSKTRIGYTTFVDERLHKKHPGNIALFDVKSMPFTASDTKKSGTKKDPHYSIFNGTFKMLRHDFLHHIEQQEVESLLKTRHSYEIDWRDHLTRINEIRHKLKSYNSGQNIPYKFLTNALFLLSHEFSNLLSYSDDFPTNVLLRHRKAMPKNAEFLDVITYLQSIMDYKIKNDIRQATPALPQFNRPPSGYKVDQRDHEYALRYLSDLNGQPLMPENFSKLPASEKQIAVADAFTRFWDTFGFILHYSCPDIYGSIESKEEPAHQNNLADLVSLLKERATSYQEQGRNLDVETVSRDN